MNPIQQRIAEGMSPLAAFLTDATCGEACWEARELVCRCECGGRNHGCMKREGAERPERHAKIDGYRYKLVAVSKNYGEMLGKAKVTNEKDGPRSAQKITETMTYTYHWHETDKGAPARVKPASKTQLTSWKELEPFRSIERWERAYLLWEKI